MRYINGFIILALLTACDDSVDTNQTDSVTSSTNTNSTNTPESSSSSSTQSTQSTDPTKFIYLLVGGKVCGYPIDASTKDIIQPQYGSPWCVNAASSHNFFSMVMDPSGSYIYASDSTGSKIYEYKITQDYVYSEYTSSIPLTSLGTFNTNVASSYMSFGSNGYLYIQNYNYNPVRDDKLSLTNGLLSNVATVVESTEISNYGMTFAHITSVDFNNETYTIDSQTNRVVHYTNGVIQTTFQPLQSGTISAIAIH